MLENESLSHSKCCFVAAGMMDCGKLHNFSIKALGVFTLERLNCLGRHYCGQFIIVIKFSQYTHTLSSYKCIIRVFAVQSRKGIFNVVNKQ